MDVLPTGPADAAIMLVGEFPHEQDILQGAPFMGGPGFELTKMLGEAGISREQCFVTLVNRTRAVGGTVDGLIAKAKNRITPAHVFYNGKYVLPSVVAGIEQLRAEIELANPNVIVTFGNLALWALTGEWGAQDWRSSLMESTLVPGKKVIPTISPALVMQQWSRRPLLVHDLKRAKRQSGHPRIERPAYDFVIRPDFVKAVSALCSMIDDAAHGTLMKLAADIETRAGHIACIAFAASSTESLCIPLMSVEPGKEHGYWTEEEEPILVYLMVQLMSRVTIIGQNWNYDAQYIHRFWHSLCPSVVDTMIQQHSCFSNLEKNLSFLSSMYLEDHLHWKDDRTNWKEGPKGEGEDQYWRYNCTDAVRTFAIEQVLSNVVSAMKLDSVNAFQQGLRPIVLKTMDRGVRIDEGARAKFSREIQAAIAEREDWLRQVIGRDINIKSPKQMQEFFYFEMGLKPILNKKTKTPTTDDEALHRIAEREPILKPLTRKIAELRSLGVFHSTFVLAPADTDGRMRTSFNICGTETYRFASSANAFGSGLNFQNIPKGGETEDGGLELPNVRNLFIPDPGYSFFDIDLDSADLRIVTWESGCAWMKEQFRAGRKPYVEIMKEYYHDQTIDKHHKSYPMFKALCHGTNYLGTAAGIAPRIGLLVHETERIQKWYYGLCPEIKKWQDEIKKQVEKRRWIENAYGYRIYFFDRIEGTIFNQAVAWIPQSTVGCLINRGYVAIDAALPEVQILLQVHDSLAGQYPTALEESCKAAIVELAQVAIPYEDPLVIPVGIKTSPLSWGACG